MSEENTTTDNEPIENEEVTPPATDGVDETNPYEFGQQPEETGGKDDAAAQDGVPEEDEPYEIEWAENVVQNDDLRAMLSDHAKAAGVSAEAAGKLFSNIVASLDESDRAQRKSADEELKRDWGGEYNEKVKACKAFAVKLSEQSGVPMEKLAMFASADGFRVLDAIAKAMGEGGLKGGAVQMSNKEMAEDILTNPRNKYYDAIANPAHPLYREAQATYNKLVGIEG